MIGWLKGMIIDKSQPGKIVLDVNGVGYDVEMSLSSFFQLEHHLKAPVSLYIHTVVREDALLLYGFIEEEERAMFRTLIKVSGVGPKMAITILSSISTAELIHCLHEADATRLTKIPGVGKKTAERLVVELKDSLKDKFHAKEPHASYLLVKDAAYEAISALEALGYKRFEAEKVIKQINEGHQSCEQLIRLALKHLS